MIAILRSVLGEDSAVLVVLRRGNLFNIRHPILTQTGL